MYCTMCTFYNSLRTWAKKKRDFLFHMFSKVTVAPPPSNVLTFSISENWESYISLPVGDISICGKVLPGGKKSWMVPFLLLPYRIMYSSVWAEPWGENYLFLSKGKREWKIFTLLTPHRGGGNVIENVKTGNNMHSLFR